MSEEKRKRAPAHGKKISQITKEDVRVSLIGTVIEKDDEIKSVLLDDGTGTIKILFEPEQYNKINVGQFVRVIGIVVPALEGHGFELKGEIVQDFSKLDKSLYTKYLKFENIEK